MLNLDRKSFIPYFVGKKIKNQNKKALKRLDLCVLYPNFIRNGDKICSKINISELKNFF